MPGIFGRLKESTRQQHQQSVGTGVRSEYDNVCRRPAKVSGLTRQSFEVPLRRKFLSYHNVGKDETGALCVGRLVDKKWYCITVMMT